MGGTGSTSAAPVIQEGLGYVINDHLDMKAMIRHGIELLGCVHSQKGGNKVLNQDAAIFCQGYGSEDGVLCGVFDGHGIDGYFISKLVRYHLPLKLLNHKNAVADHMKKVSDNNLSENRQTEDGDLSSERKFLEWHEACLKAFEEMDEQIKILKRLDVSVSGTTAVIVLKQGEDLILVNLGDSRTVLGTKTENGVRAVQLTTDLKPDVPREADRIRMCNGKIFARKGEPLRMWAPLGHRCPGIAMSRSFGDFDLKNYGLISTPVVTNHSIDSDDLFVVLATDGVWDVLSNEEVVSIVSQVESKEKAPKAVVDAAVTAWKQDVSLSEVDDHCCLPVLSLEEDQADFGNKIGS